MKEVWYFTFGFSHRYPQCYVKIEGSYEEARHKMFEHFGDQWAFQYSEDKFKNEKMLNNLKEIKI